MQWKHIHIFNHIPLAYLISQTHWTPLTDIAPKIIKTCKLYRHIKLYTRDEISITLKINSFYRQFVINLDLALAISSGTSYIFKINCTKLNVYFLGMILQIRFRNWSNFNCWRSAIWRPRCEHMSPVFFFGFQIPTTQKKKIAHHKNDLRKLSPSFHISWHLLVSLSSLNVPCLIFSLTALTWPEKIEQNCTEWTNM